MYARKVIKTGLLLNGIPTYIVDLYQFFIGIPYLYETIYSEMA